MARLCEFGHGGPYSWMAVMREGAVLNRKQRAWRCVCPFVWRMRDPETPPGSVPLQSASLHGAFRASAARVKKKWTSASPMWSIEQPARRCLAIPYAQGNQQQPRASPVLLFRQPPQPPNHPDVEEAPACLQPIAQGHNMISTD